jgi:hypothetical protein
MQPPFIACLVLDNALLPLLLHLNLALITPLVSIHCALVYYIATKSQLQQISSIVLLLGSIATPEFVLISFFTSLYYKSTYCFGHIHHVRMLLAYISLDVLFLIQGLYCKVSSFDKVVASFTYYSI